MSHSNEKVLVSACLAGARCRYDGGSKPDPEIVQAVREGRAYPACPECMGGLAPGRPPAEIQGGTGADVLSGRARVRTRDGEDITESFVRGARRFAGYAKQIHAEKVILKSGSPSCGVTRIYDGTFSGRKRDGAGVTAALLQKEGIRTEER